MRPLSVATLVAPLFALAVLAGCTAGEAQQAAAPPPPEVTAAEVVVRDLKDWADFTGRLEAAGHVEVRPRVGGYVESAHFVEGGRVARGDLLFQIDRRPYEAEVARLTAERERARAELEVARSYRDRAERLLQQQATSREEYEGLAADAAVAKAVLASVEAALESAELDLAWTSVTAPIDGRVSRAAVHAGNLVDSSTLLTTVVSDDPIHAYFDVDEHTYLELIRGYGDEPSRRPHAGAGSDGAGAAAGTSRSRGTGTHRRAEAGRAPLVYVGLANEDGYPHIARLDFVDNQVDPQQGTIRARAVLSNADGRFTPGLFARLRVIGEQSYRAALVDEKAIGTDLDRKYVLIVDENAVAQYRPVELGRSVDGLRIVTSGLRHGDHVIVNGVQRVRPGMPVAATIEPMHERSPQIERFAGGAANGAAADAAAAGATSAGASAAGADAGARAGADAAARADASLTAHESGPTMTVSSR